MQLAKLSYEALNAMNRKQLSTLLSTELPQVRRNLRNIEKYVGTSQAYKSFMEKNEKLPYEYQLKYEMNTNELRKLAFSVREFERDKTSTLQGTRNFLDKMLEFGDFGDPKEVRQKMGGYRGVSNFLDMLDDIRKFAPSLEYTIGSDDTKMKAMLIAYNDVKIKDPKIIAEKARSLYYELQAEREKETNFPFIV